MQDARLPSRPDGDCVVMTHLQLRLQLLHSLLLLAPSLLQSLQLCFQPCHLFDCCILHLWVASTLQAAMMEVDTCMHRLDSPV